MPKFGVPTDAQLAKINKLAKRTLPSDEVFVFSGKSAGDMMIPGRYMKLSPELLKVMVDDAQKGVSFMYNHSWSQWNSKGVPYGKVFDGFTQASDKENETTELYLSRYIVRDDEIIDGISANALIKKIETGILSDTSIGWGTDTMTCSICNMNYYGGKCSHWRGRKYEMADGTQKVCTVTAMPPSVIIPYNNNALYEESIVWDGAYPGAIVAQSKHGDIIELPTGKFSIVQDKEEFPENTMFFGKYHNGDIVTMVKKSDHKKVHSLGSIDDKNAKGGEIKMNEKVLKMLEAFGMKISDEFKPSDETTEVFNTLAEKWDSTVQAIKDSATPLKSAEGEPTLSVGDIVFPKVYLEKEFGKALSSDELAKLAKEGQEYRTSLVDDALAMGVRAMGNGFTSDTWKSTLSNMSVQAIKDIMKTWEAQANAGIPAGRLTDPGAGGLEQKVSSYPDEAFKVGK